MSSGGVWGQNHVVFVVDSKLQISFWFKEMQIFIKPRDDYCRTQYWLHNIKYAKTIVPRCYTTLSRSLFVHEVIPAPSHFPIVLLLIKLYIEKFREAQMKHDFMKIMTAQKRWTLTNIYKNYVRHLTLAWNMILRKFKFGVILEYFSSKVYT